jgi:hypothetical protein
MPFLDCPDRVYARLVERDDRTLNAYEFDSLNVCKLRSHVVLKIGNNVDEKVRPAACSH